MIAHGSGCRSPRRRAAFTLAELLVVILVISILSSISLFALHGVREDARERRARAQITKINELITQQWEEYRTRALPLRILPGTPPPEAARMRLDALRELMRMELPDRITDLLYEDPPGSNNWLPLYPDYLDSPPSAWLAFQRRIAANAARGNIWTPQHEHSECLYMILAGIRDGDTTGLEWFLESEIGDTDEDGMPEIIDPWGKPIYFLRWAPGFASDLQDPMRREPDPFDPLRVDPRWAIDDAEKPFALFPLIYSAGRDRRYGAVRKDYDGSDPPQDYAIVYRDSNTYPYAAPFNLPGFPLRNDPYLIMPISGDRIGRRFVNGDADDDITNHFLEAR